MDQRDTPQAINDEAAEWVARMDAAPLDTAGQAELDLWLARGDRHRGALFRASVAWQMLDRAKALKTAAREPGSATPLPQEDGVEFDRAPTNIARRGLLWTGGAIAASLVAAGAGWRFWSHSPERIETALGEIRQVSFEDGSRATVNTATKLEVDFWPKIRNVRLEAGEAWFEVAKDQSRPFVVAIGDARVRAVGTAFSVHRLDGGADVQVTEGAVEVWSAGREQVRTVVKAGARTFINYAVGPQIPIEDAVGIDRKLSWRDGALKFEGNTLGEAAIEFNRYNSVKLEIDPTLVNEKIVGRFRVNEPDAFAKSASTMLNVRTEILKDRIKISKN